MVTLSVRSGFGEVETIKRFLLDGLEEGKRRLKYALDLTMERIKGFEKRFEMSTDIFLEKFKSGEVEENEETFQWWGEKKVADELKKNLEMIAGIEICQ